MTAARRRPGRPRVTLDQLVRERRFNWENQRHRRALLDAPDDLPLQHPSAEALARIARMHREWAGRGDRTLAAELARNFERVVRSG